VIAGRRLAGSAGRRLAASVGLAAALLASSAAIALADRPAVAVTIHEPGGVVARPPAVTIEALQGNDCPTYSGPAPALYDQSGTVSQPPGPNAWSLATVLECGLVPGVSPSAVTELTVRDLHGVVETGKGATLTTADLVPPGDFADGAQPLIVDGGSVIDYYRPWRGGSDLNYPDTVQEPSPSPLAIDVYEGPPLTVVARASSASVAAGAVVDFSATVADADDAGSPDPATLSYAWDFDGGAAASTAATPSVPFPNAGTYLVTVQVTDTAGGGGADTTLVTVNPAANTPTPPPPANAPATGPAQGGGGTPGAGPGKQTASHGSTTTKHPADKATHPTKPAAAVRPAAGRTNTTTVPASNSVSAQATTRVPTSTTPAAAQPAARGATPVKGPRKRATGATSGAGTVDGRLISDVAPLPVSSSPLVSIVVARPAAAPEVRRAVGASIVPALAAAISVLLLLGLGARHQLGWRRRPGTSLPAAEG
jgi:PKD repeat protein